MRFLELEAAYIVIALFILAIVVFVTTREFVPRRAFKLFVPSTIAILAIAILAHYTVTTNRMERVGLAFNEGKEVICESRAQRKVAQSVTVSLARGWSLETDVFTNPAYARGFHRARCLVK